jgi:hypothetical protein
MSEELNQNLNELIKAIRPLSVGRVEDLPYISSPPAQFVYQSTCEVGHYSDGTVGIAGNFIWNDTASAMTPARPLGENSLYFIRKLTMTADVNQNHFPQSIVTAPKFYLYKESNLAAPILREPVIMPCFLENFDYRFAFFTSDPDDQLLGALSGQLEMIADLTGKKFITITVVISAQEVIDENFISQFKKAYPRI